MLLSGAEVHALVDVATNSSLLILSGCPKPTPVFQSHILAGIPPAGLRRKASTLALARKAEKHDWHILHDTTNNEVPPCKLKSRKPYNKEDEEMLSDISEDRSKDAWIAQRGSRSGTHPDPPEYIATGLRRRRQGRRHGSKHWTTPKRLRTGVGRCRSWSAVAHW